MNTCEESTFSSAFHSTHSEVHILTFAGRNLLTFAMDFLNFDPVTKNLSVNLESVADWPEQDKTDYSHEVETLNLLAKQLVGTNSDVPPPSNQLNGNLTKQVEKMRDTGIKEMKLGKHTEAIKLLSMALEMALKRSLWESVQYQITQIVTILDARCDVYIKLNKWADAYADAHILTTIQPTEWNNFYRKARCLRRIARYSEAKSNLATAQELCKTSAAATAKVNEEISSIDALSA